MRWWGSKPQSVTDQSPDSAAFMINTGILSPHPTCLSRFLNRFISSPPTSPTSSGCHRCTSHLHPPPTYFTGTELRLPGCRPPPPPIILRRLLCAPRRVPASTVVSRIDRPPRCHSRTAPRSLSAPGGLPAAGPSASLCPASPLCPATLPVIFWSLVLWVSWYD